MTKEDLDKVLSTEQAKRVAQGLRDAIIDPVKQKEMLAELKREGFPDYIDVPVDDNKSKPSNWFTR